MSQLTCCIHRGVLRDRPLSTQIILEKNMIWFESKLTILYREEHGIYRKSMSRTLKVRKRLVGSSGCLRMLANSTALYL